MAKNSAVDSTGFAVAAKAGPVKKKLRLAFIGTGGIAGLQLKTLAEFPDVEIVGLCDIIPDRMYRYLDVAKCGKNVCFKNYNDMLRKIKPEAVSVCTPNGVHAPAAIAASKAGAHVITEKPMAMNPGECQAMIDAAAKSKKKLVIGFQYRYHPNTQLIRQAVDAGKFGPIMFARVQALRRRGIPNWGVFGRKDLQGGGPMIDIGVHILDMSLFIMGMPKPVAASGSCYTYIGNKPSDTSCMWPNWDHKTYTVEDLATGFVRFKGGMSLSIEASFAAHIEKDVFATTIMGTKGGVYVGDDGVRVFTDQDGKMVNMSPAYLPNVDSFFTKMQTWIEAIRGAKNPSPGEDGLTIQKILDGIYESARKGREMAIK